MSQEHKDRARAIVAAVSQTMFGLDAITRLAVVAFYTGGHLLLEGNPGLGKTMFVRDLAQVLRLDFGRIQFTPDLMPADITGTYSPDPNDISRFILRQGPIFTSLLLADEVNRATPKTQSAMLEAMAERQVTVLGETRRIEPPFMVFATQNPIDQEGTYDLPEAQSDRFMFKVQMPFPGRVTLLAILGKEAGAGAVADRRSNPPPASHTDPGARLLARDKDDSRRIHQGTSKAIEEVVPLPTVEAHILNLIAATNGQFGELDDVDPGHIDRLKKLIEGLLTFGLGPRAGIQLMRAAKAYSLLFLPGAENAMPEALTHTAAAVLRHRVKLDFDWEDRYRELAKVKAVSGEALRERLLLDLLKLTAPRRDGYLEALRLG